MRLEVVMAGSGFPKLRSAVTLLRSEGRNVLVDSGLVQDGPRLVAALARTGVAPGDVHAVVSTHLHYDHCGNHRLFPSARWIVGAADLADTRAFMESYHADTSPGKDATAALLRRRNEAVKDFYVRSIVREVTRNLDFYDTVLHGDPRFEPVASGGWITGEIELIATPGHTPGHLSVVAHGARPGDGARRDVLVAGDALFTRASLAGGEDVELHLAADVAAYRRTRRRLLERFTAFVPGHDGLVDACAAAPVALPESLVS